jgi:hypothetical protein
MGCTPSGTVQLPPAVSVVRSGETTLGTGLPEDNPSAARRDAAGRSPDEAVVALMDSQSRQDWKTAYAMYATPPIDFDAAAAEWRAAGEAYSRFEVLETRVVDDNSAFVRVVYELMMVPPGGDGYPVTVDEPGEWWPVHKVGRLWKIGWMPRQ